MIVVVSDLHLQDTRLDGLRRREGEQVLLTEVRRNVTAPALTLLGAQIADNARRCGAKEVDVVFAGDIFELHRTPLWFLREGGLRPTSPRSPALRDAVLAILDAVAEENADFFAMARSIVRGEPGSYRGVKHDFGGVTLRGHYMPGNHDRLVNLWPETRARARALLGIAGAGGDDGAPFPHVFERDRAAGYGVRVRHGHEYDRQNFAVVFDPKHPPPDATYDEPVFGDYVTVDLATRVALAFRAFHARELRAAGPEGDRLRRIYTAILEFDDVRPPTTVVRYLAEALGAGDAATFDLLRPVLVDAFETARASAYFAEKAGELGFAKYFDGPVGAIVDAAIRKLSGQTLARIVQAMDRLEGDGNGPAVGASAEPGLLEGTIDLVVAGHTHEPAHVGLRGRNGATSGAAYYLDSGTWRTRIDAGEAGAFGRLRAYTMICCYRDDELRRGESRRFESWTGHLRSEEYGPVVDRPEAEPPHARATLRFVECAVERVPDGASDEGAKLVLTLGVDAAGAQVTLEGVHDGDRLPLRIAPMEADPALDGEVWCAGVEQHEGWFVHHESPVPWAVGFVPRDAPRGAFVPGRYLLRAGDGRGHGYVLVYEVSAGPSSAPRR